MPGIVRCGSRGARPSLPGRLLLMLTSCLLYKLASAAMPPPVPPALPPDVVARYPLARGRFTHLATDPSTGRLYAGATNLLLQLSPDLRPERSAVTGPLQVSCILNCLYCIYEHVSVYIFEIGLIKNNVLILISDYLSFFIGFPTMPCRRLRRSDSDISTQ